MRSKKKINLESGKIYPVSMALLGAWFCIEITMSEQSIADFLWDKIKYDNNILEIPTENKALFKDRLFGGFRCADDANRRHIYFALGYYTFLGGEQSPMSKKDRGSVFKELIEHNKSTWLGDGPFTNDYKPYQVEQGEEGKE